MKKRSWKSCAGFSLVEVSIAMLLLTVGIGGLVQSIGSSLKLSRLNAERIMAEDAAGNMISSMRTVPFEDIFASFNANPADDPGGIGSAPGANFAINGLRAQMADLDGMAGEISFPSEVSPAAGGWQLREDAQDAALGMPRDLNGDDLLVMDNLDHAADYIVLPITLRIRWLGATGNNVMELNLIMTE